MTPNEVKLCSSGVCISAKGKNGEVLLSVVCISILLVTLYRILR